MIDLYSSSLVKWQRSILDVIAAQKNFKQKFGKQWHFKCTINSREDLELESRTIFFQ